eukprot:GHVU01139532.1.p1 GENE.GHVU01139532.1~~GHVU01139532.1.p1  ORF type:complete len:682 (-),score=68.81 GHVU01139532.1:5-1807(-)
MALAADGNYRENRWFTAWVKSRQIEEFFLPGNIRVITGQDTVPFGDLVLSTLDAAVASETCEELFTPRSPHIDLGLDGVEIFANGSGSHHQLRKLDQRINLMKDATAKSGGIYLYANQQGCDGGRLYFDGCASILINGDMIAQGSQFSLQDVEVITATVDLSQVRSFRGSFMSRSVQAAETPGFPRIKTGFALAHHPSEIITLDEPQPIRYHQPEEEIGFGPACWLWDYLRRSGTSGYFLPISGGADSGATAAIVGIMTQLVALEARLGNKQIIEDARRLAGLPLDDPYIPTDAKEFCSRIFFTAYLGSKNSSEETKSRAAAVAKEIGANHLALTIDDITESFMKAWSGVSKLTPKFTVFGGSTVENLALQNIQARSRMVLSYFLAQLLLWNQGRKGALLVLGSANVDEALRGYLTKYDCSSADINPIGGIAKTDLKKFLQWAAENRDMPALESILKAKPTAELEPITEKYAQTDEEDMGMSYDELSVFGRLRKINRCGPVSMFEYLVQSWNHLSPDEVAAKVKRFFFYYSINRHKLTTLTPSYHAESYSPEDNRYDLRPFLYNSKWSTQFRAIDELVARMNAKKQKNNAASSTPPKSSL